MLYKSGFLEMDPYVQSVPLGDKRKRGRQKRIPNSLVRSPIKIPSAPEPEVGNGPVQKVERGKGMKLQRLLVVLLMLLRVLLLLNILRFLLTLMIPRFFVMMLMISSRQYFL
jgi:hypothetical protein